jgi:hypothetical protein
LARAQKALRLALLAHANGEIPDGHVREAVLYMREESTARPVTAEELAMVLRSAWDGDGDGAGAHVDPHAPFGEIVRLCVREYYRQERGEI